jgi:uncharacterized membrane protein
VAVNASVQPRTVPALEAHSRSLKLSYELSLRLVVVAYSVVYSAAGVLDYVGFRSASYDLGNAVQAIWNTAHGHILETTAENGDAFSRLGWHIDPLLVLFAPLWWIWSSPVILLVVQAIAVSLGALPVFWLARKHLGSEKAATAFALAYLAYPATQWNALDPNLGFHPISLALPLLLYALWWLDEERWVPFAIVAVLAAASNEQIAVIVGCLGLWYGLTRKRPVFGASLFATGLAITVIDFLIVPRFSTSGTNPFADRYLAVGGSAGGILKTLVLHPIRAAEVIPTGHKLAYVALLFVPLLGLCFRAPLLLFAAVPPLVINLLSSSSDQNVGRESLRRLDRCHPLRGDDHRRVANGRSRAHLSRGLACGSCDCGHLALLDGRPGRPRCHHRLVPGAGRAPRRQFDSGRRAGQRQQHHRRAPLQPEADPALPGHSQR